MIASHNSFTYLKPRKWWMRLFKFMAKCQSKSIKEQYEKYGVRMFDLRVDFTKDEQIMVKHGLAIYKITYGELMDILKFLNGKKNKKYMDVTLECSYKESKNIPLWKELEFIKFCKHIQETYKRITFTGGYAKHCWRNLYNFGNRVVEGSVSKFASVATKNKIDDLWPWLYAKRHNKKSLEENKDKFVWIDFVEIQ